MHRPSSAKQIGFFTRVLDDVPPAERYRLAIEQIRHAERFGFASAWVAQHHFDGQEGGIPSPFVFLADAAARTSTIRLGTGILTLALEHPLRAAEDAAVLDVMSGGRLELGLGTGGSPGSFAAFGHAGADRGDIFGRHIETFLAALRGQRLEGDVSLYPAVPDLTRRIWQATFSAAGGARAGAAGDGLMLSRTQPRPAGSPDLRLADIQKPIIDAYLGALPEGVEPRIVASRSVFVADSRSEALRLAEAGLGRWAARAAARGQAVPGGSLADIIRASDLHVGTAADVTESLAADDTLARATHVAVQVHSADPPHPQILRSIELFAIRVAPALGWTDPPAAWFAAQNAAGS